MAWWFPFLHPSALEIHRMGQEVICALREGERLPDQIPGVMAEGGIRGIYGATVRAAEEADLSDMVLWVNPPRDASNLLDLSEGDWRRAFEALEEGLEALRCALPYLLGEGSPKLVLLLPRPQGLISSAIRGALSALASSFEAEARELGLSVICREEDQPLG